MGQLHAHPKMFLTDLLLHSIGNRKWEVAVPFVVETKTMGIVTVDAGFECDLNSIPQFLWFVSTPADFPEAGVCHDWGYRGHMTRAQADAVYLEILEALGMGKVRRNLRYAALRVFGRFSYKG